MVVDVIGTFIGSWRVQEARTATAEHRPTDRVRVHRVQERVPVRRVRPYFIAVCECGWSAEATDLPARLARLRTFAEARRHSRHVQPDVIALVD